MGLKESNTMSDRLTDEEICKICHAAMPLYCDEDGPVECKDEIIKATVKDTANYYETVVIPALYEKWSQESINVRKATAKELIEEIEQMEDICEILDCNIDCLNLKRCKAWQRLKQKRGK